MARYRSCWWSLPPSCPSSAELAAGGTAGRARPGRGSARPRLVPDPSARDHDLGALRVLLDLGTEPLAVHVNEPGLPPVAVTPHLLQQHLPPEHPPRLPSL